MRSEILTTSNAIFVKVSPKLNSGMESTLSNSDNKVAKIPVPNYVFGVGKNSSELTQEMKKANKETP